MNLKKLFAISLFAACSTAVWSQKLSPVPPVQYPVIEVTPAMQAAKEAAGALQQTPPGGWTNTSSFPTCNHLTPICTAPGQYYSLTTAAGAPSAHVLSPGNNYGCLSTTPNPMWYYIKIDSSGPIGLQLSAQLDIDFGLWGPYPSLAVAEASCSTHFQLVSCSYSASNNEFIQIPAAAAGQYYVLLITNFANVVQNATLTQVGGNGRMGCDGFSSMSGTVYNDANGDCAFNGGDTPMPGIYLQSTWGYSVSNGQGNYSIIADSGTHTVTQVIPAYLQPLMVSVCDSSHTVAFTNTPLDTTGLDFFNEVLECPYLTVDISSNRRRRCFTNQTTVQYCNEGFADAVGAQVYVEFPQYVHFVSANLPHTIDTNGYYVFNVGNLTPGQCGTIHIVDSVACVNGIMGLVQCTRAWITPPNSCVEDADTTINPNDPWDKSSVSVSGVCIGDSVARFTITNTGSPINGNMQGPSQYRIYIDGLLVYTGYFQIGGGATFVVEVPAAGGVIRLEADQRPGHPGNSHPNHVIQGCGNASGGGALANWLAFNAQSADDAEVTIEEDCLPIMDSYDPNDKAVSPGGAGPDRIVPPGTLLDYTIRFQNTGNDVAYRVIIRDTLQTDLDISTLQLVGHSHNYDFYLTGTDQPILVFDHKNINLPDSASQPLASQGFVKFKIAPRAATPLGTVIENRAGIYFDYNEPIITNTAWITIDNPATGPAIEVNIISGTELLSGTELPLSAYPNPTTGLLRVDLGQSSERTLLSLYGADGRLHWQQNADFERFVDLDLSKLPEGVYLIQAVADRRLGVLKVVKQ